MKIKTSKMLSEVIKSRIQQGCVLEQTYYHLSDSEEFLLIDLNHHKDDFVLSKREWEEIKRQYNYRTEVIDSELITQITYFFN